MTRLARPTRLRRRLLLVLALLGLAVTVPLTAASPAEAAGVSCGPQKVARVSIKYKACGEYLGGHAFEGSTRILNDHGSPVRVAVGMGWTVNGKTYWDSGSVTLKGDHNYHTYWDVSITLVCRAGDRVSYKVRIKQNNGDWGPTSSSATWTC